MLLTNMFLLPLNALDNHDHHAAELDLYMIFFSYKIQHHSLKNRPTNQTTQSNYRPLVVGLSQKEEIAETISRTKHSLIKKHGLITQNLVSTVMTVLMIIIIVLSGAL